MNLTIERLREERGLTVLDRPLQDLPASRLSCRWAWIRRAVAKRALAKSGEMGASL